MTAIPTSIYRESLHHPHSVALKLIFDLKYLQHIERLTELRGQCGDTKDLMPENSDIFEISS